MSFLRDQPALTRQFKAGERNALEAVYRAYLKLVSHIVRVRWFGHARQAPSDFADIVQEIFTKAFSESARHGYDGLREYGPYLGRIAYTTMVDFARRHRREIPSDWTDDIRFDMAQPLADPSPWEDARLIPLVENYLRTLPEKLRMLHQLRYVENKGQEESAVHLGVSRQTIRTMEKRLRDGLRAHLTANGAMEPESVVEQPNSRTFTRTSEG